MPKRTSKPEDVNVIASEILQGATEQSAKNPAAVALGRLGGLKGGPARAKKLSAKKRKKIAQKAAHARWSAKS
jgi:hypothetical protein